MLLGLDDKKSGEEICPEICIFKKKIPSLAGSFHGLHPCFRLPCRPVWFSFTTVIITPRCHRAEIRPGRGPAPVYFEQSDECLREENPPTQQLHKERRETNQGCIVRSETKGAKSNTCLHQNAPKKSACASVHRMAALAARSF